MLNQGIDVKQMIADLPHGLDRAILRVLSYHVGRENAISRQDLLEAVASHGFIVQDRQLRLAINEQKKQGVMICSTGGVNGGYWLAANWSELQEYIDRELHSRAMDLLEQEQALKAAAEKRWGKYSIQERLPI